MALSAPIPARRSGDKLARMPTTAPQASLGMSRGMMSSGTSRPSWPKPASAERRSTTTWRAGCSRAGGVSVCARLAGSRRRCASGSSPGPYDGIGRRCGTNARSTTGDLDRHIGAPSISAMRLVSSMRRCPTAMAWACISRKATASAPRRAPEPPCSAHRAATAARAPPLVPRRAAQQGLLALLSAPSAVCSYFVRELGWVDCPVVPACGVANK